eukprot:5158533-Pleurochrysis_carterae.AAC.3
MRPCVCVRVWRAAALRLKRPLVLAVGASLLEDGAFELGRVEDTRLPSCAAKHARAWRAVSRVRRSRTLAWVPVGAQEAIERGGVDAGC